MTFRLFLILMICALTQPCFSQDKKPVSVIVIMADQLRFDVLGDLTPNIQSLRKDGVAFANSYCASPICVPSRSSFFTGLYPNRSGALINGWEKEDKDHSIVKPEIPNLYTLMEERWDSWHIGKQHFFTAEKIDENPKARTRWITQKNYNAWIKDRGVVRRGGKQFQAAAPELISGQSTHTRNYSIPSVERYEGGIENFLDHYIGNECVAAIRNRDRNKPLLLNAMFLAPHPPFHFPDPYYSLFDNKEVDVPENVGVWYPRQSPLQLYNLTGFLGTRYSREDWKAVWKKYLGLVKLLDDEVGRIIKALKEEGLYDNSIIVFTADHGEMLGSHSLWQKMCMYEESSRVPLIIKFPRIFHAAAREVDVPVSLVDVLPTLLDYNGIAVPERMDGRSLLPLIQGKQEARSPVFIQYDGNGALGNFQRCVVSGEFKLIVDIFKDEIFLELYNVRNDPMEKENLAFEAAHASKTRTLVKLLRDHMLRTGDRLQLPENIHERFLNQYKTMLQR